MDIVTPVISPPHIACDVIWVQHVILQKKVFLSVKSFFSRPGLLLNWKLIYLWKWLSAWLLILKATLDNEGPNFFKLPSEENLKQQWLIKIKSRNIQSIQHARMCHAYYFGSNPSWQKMRFQLVLNNTFCPTPKPHPLTIKTLKKNKN